MRGGGVYLALGNMLFHVMFHGHKEKSGTFPGHVEHPGHVDTVKD